VQAKKDPTTCDGRALKAISRDLHARYSALAFQSQLELQTSYLARRFGLAPWRAAIVAELAFPAVRI
jgi:hypothetical protein